MCLAVPGKIVEKDEKGMGKVDVMGVLREVSFTLAPEAEIGDYVLVHAGFAIQVIDEDEAMKTLAIFKGMDPDELS